MISYGTLAEDAPRTWAFDRVRICFGMMASDEGAARTFGGSIGMCERDLAV
jgi:hypothetical protein